MMRASSARTCDVCQPGTLCPAHEPVAVEVVEVDSGHGPVHAECWAWPDGQPVGAGSYAYTQEGPGAMPAAIARAFRNGAVRVVVYPIVPRDVSQRCEVCREVITDHAAVVARDHGQRDSSGMAPQDYCASCRDYYEFYGQEVPA